MACRQCADDVSWCRRHMCMRRWHVDDVWTMCPGADDTQTMCGRCADDTQMTCRQCADGVHVTPGAVLHEIRQLRQEEAKPSWTALHKAERRLTCYFFLCFKVEMASDLGVKSQGGSRITCMRLRASVFFRHNVTGYQIASLGFSHCEIQGFYRAGKFNYFLSNNATVEPRMLHQRLT